jgi:hypothetical protein
MAPRGAGRAWLAVLAAAAACCHAQLASAGAKRIPPVDAETEVGMGDWASLGWKVGTSHADVLRLGDKFQLSGVGDSVKDDDWLRLFDVGNRGFYGGFAAGKLWGKELIGNSLQIGNKWQVSESPDGDWLRLTAAGSGAQLGGLAVGKMKANSLLVEGSTQTNELQISKQFLLSPDKAWLHLVDPLTKKTHTSGGLQFGNAKAESVQSNGVHVAKTLRLGDKWKLNVEGGTTASDDEYLRLTGLDGKTLHGGVASAKMSTEQLEVGHSATFKGTTTMEGDATFKGKVVFDKVATMGSTITSLSQIGNMILSNVDAKTQASDGLHVYQADGKTYGSVVSGEMKSATTSTALLQLGNKWRLSGTGDKFHDDDWVTL